MSYAPVFNYAQRSAHKLSPCWTDDTASSGSSQGESFSPQHGHHLRNPRYDTASVSDDSDSYSQTSSQASAAEDGDSNYTSPPTSVSSDGESVCDGRNNPNSQTLQGSAPLTSFATQHHNIAGQPSIESGQEIHNVALRPKNGFSSQDTRSGWPTQIPAGQFETQNTTSTTDKFESRRRRCSFSGMVCPPKLRRDTDNTEAIVKMIVVFCTNLINSIWCPRAFEDPTSTSMAGSGVLPLQIFITETLRRSKTSYSTLQIALYYLILLKQCMPCQQGNQSGQSGCRAMQCGRRMFLTALILASKYLQDRNYSARAWSKISGLPLKEINENERRYLGMICWDLHVPKELFENWSKIVLAICRLSSDGDVPGRDNNQRPPGPAPGLGGLKQTQLQSMCGDTVASRNWWLNHLRSLSVGMVKCSRQTEDFLSTVSPFKPTSEVAPQFFFDPLPRVDSPDSTVEKEVETATSTPKCLPRLPSIDRISQSFQILERSGSPITSYKIPPQPVLRNLPTPQTTPRAEATNLWTGLYRPNLRCRASASALGFLDKNLVPTANLETCPPPKPRPCDRSRGSNLSSWTSSFNHWQSSKESTPSLSSSPESVVSDFSSIPARSRSSSISSTSSWLPTAISTPVQDSECRFRRDVMTLQQKLAADRMPAHARRMNQSQTRPHLSRCQTAVKLSGLEDEGCIVNDRPSHPTIRHSQSMGFADEGYGSEDMDLLDRESRSDADAAQTLLTFQSRPSVPGHMADPIGNRSASVSNEEMLRRKSSQFLKRTRSDSTDIYQLNAKLANLSGQQSLQNSQDPWLSQLAGFDTMMSEGREKQTQVPNSAWATPRKPIQCGAQNKRMAMQTPEPASSVAANFLRQELLVG